MTSPTPLPIGTTIMPITQHKDGLVAAEVMSADFQPWPPTSAHQSLAKTIDLHELLQGHSRNVYTSHDQIQGLLRGEPDLQSLGFWGRHLDNQSTIDH
jgi:hypothetical protein